MNVDSTKTRLPFRLGKLAWLGLGVLLCGFPCWSQQASVAHTAKSTVPDSRRTEASTLGQQTDQQRSGSISGKVVDQSGAYITGALVKLTQEGQPSSTEALSDDNGQFSLSNVAPGPFQLTITSPGLAAQEFSGILSPGEAYVTPIIMLTIATQVTEVHVALTPDELAEVQVKDQEKQRVLGFIPNFYVEAKGGPVEDQAHAPDLLGDSTDWTVLLSTCRQAQKSIRVQYAHYRCV